jgi:hypothetical protein
MIREGVVIRLAIVIDKAFQVVVFDSFCEG